LSPNKKLRWCVLHYEGKEVGGSWIVFQETCELKRSFQQNRVYLCGIPMG
jgi:hypothetical protein